MSSGRTSFSGSQLTRRANAPRLIELCDEALAEAGSDVVRSTRILGVPELHVPVPGGRPGGTGRRQGRVGRAEQVGDPTLLAAVIARVGHAEVWAAETPTPGLARTRSGDRGAFRAPARILRQPACGVARSWGERGEIERAHAIFEELEQNAIERGDEGSRWQIMWRRSLWSGTWAAGSRRSSKPLRHYEIGRDTGWASPHLHGPHQGTDRDGSRPRRAGASFGGGKSPACEGDLGRGRISRAVACSADSSSRSGTSRPLATTSATFPAGLLSLGYNDPAAPFWPRCDRDPRLSRRARAGPGILGGLRANTALASETRGRAPRSSQRRPARRRRGRRRLRTRRVRARPRRAGGRPCRSSAAARCSASARSVGRHSRRRRPERRSSRRSRSSRSSVLVSGREGEG